MLDICIYFRYTDMLNFSRPRIIFCSNVTRRAVDYLINMKNLEFMKYILINIYIYIYIYIYISKTKKILKVSIFLFKAYIDLKSSLIVS